MIAQYNNIVTSSLCQYLDNLVCRKGQAFENISGSKLYKQNTLYNNYHVYSLPYAQIINDHSIPNAVVMTGLYLNNNFIVKGQSGFVDFNYERGQAYFSTGLPSNAVLSGNFAVKDFNVTIPRVNESTLLFETKYVPRPKNSQTPTGLKNDEISYPVIFVKNKTKKIDPLELGGGNEWDRTMFSVYIIADSLFKCDAAESIIHDSIRTYFGLIPPEETNISYLGGLKTGRYDYLGQSTQKINNNSGVYICSLRNVDFHGIVRSELEDLNPNTYVKVIDLEAEYVRAPRA